MRRRRKKPVGDILTSGGIIYEKSLLEPLAYGRELEARLIAWSKIDIFWMLTSEAQAGILGFVPQNGNISSADRMKIYSKSKTELCDMLPEKERRFVLTTYGWNDPNACKKLMARANASREA